MAEEKKFKRGWVKNVAIIFLAVLLVLTFFSNTIMNRSLPEVLCNTRSLALLPLRYAAQELSLLIRPIMLPWNRPVK